MRLYQPRQRGKPRLLPSWSCNEVSQYSCWDGVREVQVRSQHFHPHQSVRIPSWTSTSSWRWWGVPPTLHWNNVRDSLWRVRNFTTAQWWWGCLMSVSGETMWGAGTAHLVLIRTPPLWVSVVGNPDFYVLLAVARWSSYYLPHQSSVRKSQLKPKV